MKQFTYWTDTLADDTGHIETVQNVPFANDFRLEERLWNPEPFAPSEWSQDAVALFDERLDEEVDWSQCDTFTLFLYPVISPRFKALLESALRPDEIEFLPLQLVGKETGGSLGTYYIPHCLKAYDCMDHDLIRRSPRVLLYRDRFPPDARLFIAPDETHNHLVFREDLADLILEAGITGIEFYQLETDEEAEETPQVPLGQLFFATPEEQQAWLAQALAEGAHGLYVWQLWEAGSPRIRTEVARLRAPADVAKIRWDLSEGEAEATLQMRVYLSRVEWSDRCRFVEQEGEVASGGLGEWLQLGAADATSQGWYGHLEVGYRAGLVLVRGGWWLPLGWQGVAVEAFAELYRWWEGLGSRWARLGDVEVRHRGEEKELDEVVWVSEGAARWYVGGGELRSSWRGGKVRLVGRGLSRIRRELGR
ncbi:MAG: hypothetical protein K6U12_14220 [Armatimonadetes bacterium]|nr:hypothetical protein [Armatimonadota bacterium]